MAIIPQALYILQWNATLVLGFVNLATLQYFLLTSAATTPMECPTDCIFQMPILRSPVCLGEWYFIQT